MKTNLFLPLIILFLSCNDKEKKVKINPTAEPNITLVQKVNDYKIIVDSLTKVNQKKLDAGVNMLQTEKSYYAQMDSMLNVVYQDLIKSYNKTDAEHLKKEQRQWLMERDTFFSNIQKKYQKESGSLDFLPKDYQLIIYGEKTLFVEEKVHTLINLLDKK